MFNYLSIRVVNFLSFLAIVGLLGMAVYLQRVLSLEPCSLCILQRLIFILLAFVFLVGVVLPTRLWVIRIHAVFVVMVAILGLVAVGRQLWLIYFATTVTPCGVDFNYLLANLPWHELLRQMLEGGSDCTKETWRLFGVGLPEWSGLAFLFFLGIGVWQFMRVEGVVRLQQLKSKL
ncbi:MAG: disulfide bond formation protein B [Gammaproteobacteria bacterium]|nr:disulfide bond formation protein B [Gammaproteobacteria bacterium]